MKIRMSAMISMLVWTAGCGSLEGQSGRIAISEDNALGVVAIQLDRFDDGDGAKVFELRGLDSSDQEVGIVRLRTGSIAGLHQYVPGDGDLGSEINISVTGTDTRMLTRETVTFAISPHEPAIAEFMAIAEVASALNREGHIVARADQDDSPGEQAYLTGPCAASGLNVTPVALECCTQAATGASTQYFHRSDEVTIQKVRCVTSSGTCSCKALDGVTACNGTDCYWGPNGYARPYLITPPAGTFAHIYVAGYTTPYGDYRTCGHDFTATNPAQVFSDVTGTFPNGQGCPGGASGAGEWDY